MERDHSDTPARFQELRRCLQAPLEIAEFVVHCNTKRLENTRSRMNSTMLWPEHGFHQSGELRCGFQWRVLALGDNFTGNRAGAFLFAIHAKDPGEFIETSSAEDVLGGGFAFTVGFPGLAGHAPIARAFPLKAEPTP